MPESAAQPGQRRERPERGDLVGGHVDNLERGALPDLHRQHRQLVGLVMKEIARAASISASVESE